MISFFIDTSSSYITVALIKDKEVLSLINEKNDNTLSERIFTYIKDCFNKARITTDMLDKIFVVNGPGSFTGIRVGVTIAKTMAWALNIPVIPLSSLELIATTNVNTDYIVSYIDARRDYVYAGIYDKNLDSFFNDSYILIRDLLNKIPINKTITWIGYDEIDGINNIFPSIDIINIINKHMNDKPVNPHSLNPKYLKNTEAEEKLNNGN